MTRIELLLEKLTGARIEGPWMETLGTDAEPAV